MVKWFNVFLLSFILAACTQSTAANQVTPTTQPRQTPTNTAPALEPIRTVTPLSNTEQVLETPSVQPTPTSSATPFTESTSTSPPTQPPPVKIYAWKGFSRMIDSHYGYYHPDEMDNSKWNFLLPYDNFNFLEPTDSNADGPNHSIIFEFSQYKQEIAYIVRNEKAELWISDVELRNPELVWIDEDAWLEEMNDVFFRIFWGLDDRYILMIPSIAEERVAIYDTRTKMTKKWDGTCDIIARSPLSDNLSIWCNGKNPSQPSSYLVLGKEGIFRTQERPKIISRAIDWSFSPGGERLLFAAEDLSISIANEDGTLKELPATFESGEVYDISIRRNLQWSQDGKEVLVYGFGEPKNLCPAWNNSTDPEVLSDRPCWLIFDVSNGEVVWKPDQELAQSEIPWKYLMIVHGASLSQNGDLLAMIVADWRSGRNYYLYITSLKEGWAKLLRAEEYYQIKWGDEK